MLNRLELILIIRVRIEPCACSHLFFIITVDEANRAQLSVLIYSITADVNYVYNLIYAYYIYIFNKHTKWSSGARNPGK